MVKYTLNSKERAELIKKIRKIVIRSKSKSDKEVEKIIREVFWGGK